MIAQYKFYIVQPSNLRKDLIGRRSSSLANLVSLSELFAPVQVDIYKNVSTHSQSSKYPRILILLMGSDVLIISLGNFSNNKKYKKVDSHWKTPGVFQGIHCI